MGHFSTKSAVSQPTCQGGDTHEKKILAQSASDGWSSETLQSIMSMMTATWLSFKGHFCLSFTPIEHKSPLQTQNSHGSTRLLERGLHNFMRPKPNTRVTTSGETITLSRRDGAYEIGGLEIQDVEPVADIVYLDNNFLVYPGAHRLTMVSATSSPSRA